MAESGVEEALLELGFSLNESRAYAALLVEHPATGYEVAARAQIPRSAVYGVLRKLVKAGAARSTAGPPERFIPTPAQEILDLLRKRFESSTQKFERAIKEIDRSPEAPDAYTVRGYQRVLEEAERLVQRASHKLIVSGWGREIEHLVGELKRAVKQRRVFLVVFSHSHLPDLPGHVFTDGLSEAELETFSERRLVIVSDDALSLVASTEMSERDSAVISETQAIAEVATSQVALDIDLLSQRTGIDAAPVMSKMLGPKAGRLEALLAQASRTNHATRGSSKAKTKTR